MSVKVIDTLKPKNEGAFPIAEAADIAVTAEKRLPEALADKADASALAETNATVAGKANTSDVTAATNNLQSQINELITPVTQDAEVQNARVGADGTSYQTLKARLDSENALLNEKISELASFSTNICPHDNYLANSFLELDGTISSSNSYYVTDYIAVTPSTTYAKSSIIHIGFYTAEKEFISRTNNAARSTFTTPNNAYYVRGTTNAQPQYWQVNKGSEVLPYEEPNTAFINNNVSFENVIDNTFSESGKLADAKLTGDLIGAATLAIGKNTSDIKEIDGSIYSYSENVANIKDPKFGYYIKEDGTEGTDSTYFISSFSKIEPRVDYISSNNTLIGLYDADQQFIERKSIAQNGTFNSGNAQYLKVSAVNNVLNDIHINKGTTLEEKDTYFEKNNITDTVQDISKFYSDLYTTVETAITGFVNGKYIKTDLGIGKTVDVSTELSASTISYKIIAVQAGEVYRLYGTGYSEPRFWCLTNENYQTVALARANSSATADNKLEIRVITDGYLIVNVGSTSYGLSKATLAVKNQEEPVSPFERQGLSGYSHDYAQWYTGMFNTYPDATAQGFSFKYADALNLMDALMATDTAYITKNKLGDLTSTDESENPYAIYEYVFKPKNYLNASGKKHPKILIDSCIHGFEKNSLFGIYYFLYDLVNNWNRNTSLENLRSNVEIHFIPVLNPWGFDRNIRANENGVNLNRNYDAPNWTAGEETGSEPFDQEETVISRDWMIANNDAMFYFNVHTNGHYNANGYSAMNACMAYINVNDRVYNKLFNAFKYHIEKQTLMFPKMYDFINPTAAQFCGTESNGNWDNITSGYADCYSAYYQHIPSMTLEGCNGLVVDDVSIFEVLSADSKKINSEIFGNMILNMLAEYLN